MDIITRAVSPASVSNVNHIEYYTGASCTGTTGAANRVLTLANTSLSYNMVAYLDGLALHSSLRTITNNASASTVQFLVPVDDDNLIVVSYIA